VAILAAVAPAGSAASGLTPSDSAQPSNPPFVPKPERSPALPGAVDIAAVSNGCGGGKHFIGVQNYVGDTSVSELQQPLGHALYGHFPACNLHDAGYSGALVWDNINGRWVDSFSMTKKQVDDQFLTDLLTLCQDQIKNAPVALSDCEHTGGKTALFAGAVTYYNWVVKHGEGYRSRPDISGNWKGATDNVSPPWTITQKKRVVTGRWCGNKADHHPGLTGRLNGTLVSYDPDQTVPPPREDEVDGTYSIHEGSLSPGGDMTIILNGKDPNQLTVKLGTGVAYLVRTSATVECPAT